MDSIDYSKILNDSLKEIIGLLEIPSVYDEDTSSSDMPYGEGVCKAFAYMKHIAERDGFEVKEYDGHALSIAVPGAVRKIDVVSHIDVVAAEKEAFDIRIEGKHLIGRGTSDMKVPMYLTYLALKKLRDDHPDLSRPFRIVLGGDEERTMEDMRYYVKKEGMPLFAFTPDGHFPLGISEKGAIMWTLECDYQGNIISLKGGSQCNIIPDHACCRIKGTEHLEDVREYIARSRIDASVCCLDGDLLLETRGKAAHASMPALGHSATVDMLKIVGDIWNDESCARLYELFFDSYGRGIDAFAGEDPNDCLSLNLGTLNIADGMIYAQIDCRYPFGMNAEELTGKMRQRSGFKTELAYNDDPTRCEEDDPYVAVMLKTYRRITGDYSDCVVSGGVSYTKVFGHCVSFGPTFPGQESMAHKKDEYIDLDNCVRMLEIYYEAMKGLAEVTE